MSVTGTWTSEPSHAFPGCAELGLKPRFTGRGCGGPKPCLRDPWANCLPLLVTVHFLIRILDFIPVDQSSFLQNFYLILTRSLQCIMRPSSGGCQKSLFNIFVLLSMLGLQTLLATALSRKSLFCALSVESFWEKVMEDNHTLFLLWGLKLLVFKTTK